LAARGEDEPKSLIYSGFYQNGALWHTDVLVTPPPTIKNDSPPSSGVNGQVKSLAERSFY
jgi:hypothetical protein